MRPGDVVAVLSNTPAEQVLGFLGTARVGALPTILSHPSIKQSVDRFLESFPKILKGCNAKYALCSAMLFDPAQSWKQSHGIQTTLLPFPSLDVADGDSFALPVSARKPEETLFLQYSSGTTGQRKGIAVTGAMLEFQLRNIVRTLSLTRDDRVVHWLPLYHDMGLIGAFLVPLLCGFASVHLSPFEWLQKPLLLFQYTARYQGTVWYLPNFAVNFLATRVSESALDGLKLGSLRWIFNAGETLRPATHEKFLERFRRFHWEDRLQSAYGTAENTFAVSISSDPGGPKRLRADAAALTERGRFEPANEPQGRALTILSSGRPQPGQEVRIRDAQGPGSVGEIELRSGSLFSGYVENPDASGAVFTQDGWYRTGDMGFLWEGQLFVTGRAKDLIIVNGANVYPADVEEIADAIPGVKAGRAVAFGVELPSGSEGLVVMLERDELAVPDPSLKATLRAEVLAQLGVALTDIRVAEPGTLLKSTSGKLARGKNRALYLERQETFSPGRG